MIPLLWTPKGVNRHQPTLPGFASAGLPQMKRYLLGRLGEATVRDALIRAGYYVIDGKARGGDLMVVERGGACLRIEVKTARRGAGGYQFCLRRVLNRECTDYRHADVLILLAVRDDAFCDLFIIPVSEIPNQLQITMTNPLQSQKYTRYRVDRLELEGIEKWKS